MVGFSFSQQAANQQNAPSRDARPGKRRENRPAYGDGGDAKAAWHATATMSALTAGIEGRMPVDGGGAAQLSPSGIDRHQKILEAGLARKKSERCSSCASEFAVWSGRGGRGIRSSNRPCPSLAVPGLACSWPVGRDCPKTTFFQLPTCRPSFTTTATATATHAGLRRDSLPYSGPRSRGRQSLSLCFSLYLLF